MNKIATFPLHFFFQAILPDSDEFRFGIQKCNKTIQDGVKDQTVFQFEGVENLFELLRKNQEEQDCRMYMASYVRY